MKLIPFLTVFFLCISTWNQAQNTFQHIFELEGSAIQILQSTGLEDGGIAVCGLFQGDPDTYPFLSRLDCAGEELWTRTFGISFSWNNTEHPVLQMSDGSIVFGTNIGSFQDYNILIVKTDLDGNILWQRVMNGVRNDQVKDMKETPDGGLIIVGGTNSYGSDASGSVSYLDVYVTKLNEDGEVQWSRTFGNPQAIDNANAVINTSDNGYAITGRYIERGAFHALLLKLDDQGDLEFIKTYGDTLHRNYAYDLLQVPGGGYVITGSTTLNKANHTSPSDVFLLKTDLDGNLEWATSYTGSASDQSDIGSSLIQTLDGGFGIGVATRSFPFTGNVTNKHVVMKTDALGNLSFTKAYNTGGSHYPYLADRGNKPGYLLTGYSNSDTDNFSGTVFMLDFGFESGCNENDYSSLTVQQTPVFKESDPPVSVDSGSTWGTVSVYDSIFFSRLVLCEEIVDTCSSPVVAIPALPASDHDIKVYPNPSRGGFHIEVKSSMRGDLHLILFDLLGRAKEIRTVDNYNPSHPFHFPLSDYSPGTYLLRIQHLGQVVIKKIVLEE